MFCFQTSDEQKFLVASKCLQNRFIFLWFSSLGHSRNIKNSRFEEEKTFSTWTSMAVLICCLLYIPKVTNVFDTRVILMVTCRDDSSDLYKGISLYQHYLSIVVKECTAAMQHSYAMPCASYLHLQVHSQVATLLFPLADSMLFVYQSDVSLTQGWTTIFMK